MVKILPTNAGDMSFTPGSDVGFTPWVLFPGEGNGNPLQYSCLGNPIDRRTWQATVHEVAKESDTT